MSLQLCPKKQSALKKLTPFGSSVPKLDDFRCLDDFLKLVTSYIFRLKIVDNFC